MSRPRDRANSQMVPNLYRKLDKRTGKIYYSYRDPRTGTFSGAGTDYAEAVAGAIELNAIIYSAIRTARLTAATTTTSSSPTLSIVMLRHMELCEKRDLSKNTLKNRKSQVKAWGAMLGTRQIGEITVRDLVESLKTYEDRPRMAQAMRSAAVDIWTDAVAEGWATDNLPIKTRKLAATVMRSRLSIENFHIIHAAAENLDPWTQRTMELALVSAQRREDVAAVEFRKAAASTGWVTDGRMWIEQQKTGNKVCIPLDLGIDRFVLADVIKACRDSVVSRWLIHHQRPRTLSRPGDQVWVDTISKGFAKARDLAGVTGEPGKTPPTFHEIRSLSIRLYSEKYGNDFAQALAGHKEAATTDIYRDTRGDEWVQVKAV